MAELYRMFLFWNMLVPCGHCFPTCTGALCVNVSSSFIPMELWEWWALWSCRKTLIPNVCPWRHLNCGDSLWIDPPPLFSPQFVSTNKYISPVLCTQILGNQAFGYFVGVGEKSIQHSIAIFCGQYIVSYWMTSIVIFYYTKCQLNATFMMVICLPDNPILLQWK